MKDATGLKTSTKKAWGNKTKEIILRLSDEYNISFVLFPQASEPCMNFNISKMVY